MKYLVILAVFVLCAIAQSAPKLNLNINGAERLSIQNSGTAYHDRVGIGTDVIVIEPGSHTDFLIDIDRSALDANPRAGDNKGWMMGIKTKSWSLGEGKLRVNHQGQKTYIKVIDSKGTPVSYWVFSTQTELAFWVNK